MTPAEIQKEVEILLTYALAQGWNNCWLTITKNKLDIVYHDEIKPTKKKLFRVRQLHTHEGFTPNEWDTITRNVLDYFERKKPCQTKLIP